MSNFVLYVISKAANLMMTLIGATLKYSKIPEFNLPLTSDSTKQHKYKS